MRRTIGSRRTAYFKAVEAIGLPTPRLQFRWEEIPKEKRKRGYAWLCYYELVIRLDKYDVRNPREYKKDSEMALVLGKTFRGSSNTPDHFGPVDTPFRDRAHAYWDGLQLGQPPVYAIFGDKVTKIEEKYERDDRKAA